MAVRKSKASSPDHLNKLVAGTLKDEVKKREIKKRKEMKKRERKRRKELKEMKELKELKEMKELKEKRKEMCSDNRRFVFSATSPVEIRVPFSPVIR